MVNTPTTGEKVSPQDHIRWKKQWDTLPWGVWDWQAHCSCEM